MLFTSLSHSCRHTQIGNRVIPCCVLRTCSWKVRHLAIWHTTRQFSPRELIQLIHTAIFKIHTQRQHVWCLNWTGRRRWCGKYRGPPAGRDADFWKRIAASGKSLILQPWDWTPEWYQIFPSFTFDWLDWSCRIWGRWRSQGKWHCSGRGSKNGLHYYPNIASVRIKFSGAYQGGSYTPSQHLNQLGFVAKNLIVQQLDCQRLIQSMKTITILFKVPSEKAEEGRMLKHRIQNFSKVNIVSG